MQNGNNGQPHAGKCGAKTRNGGTCKNPPINGHGRCRMHGGKTPRGPASANFKHGLYATAFKEEMRQKFDAASSIDDPLDLLPELAAQRALFVSYVERFQPGIQISLADIDALMRWSDSIGRTIERIVKNRNETALTVAEISFIKAGIIALLSEFVPDVDRRSAFIARLGTLIPERSGVGSDPHAAGAGA